MQECKQDVTKLVSVLQMVKNLPSTVDSRYLEFQGTLWNTSRYPYLDISDLPNWGKKSNEQPHLTNVYVIWLLKLDIYWKYCGKEEKFLLFSTIFCYLLLDFHVQAETRFSLRDKQLFEIIEVEITRVNCIAILLKSMLLLHLSRFIRRFVIRRSKMGPKMMCQRKNE